MIYPNVQREIIHNVLIFLSKNIQQHKSVEHIDCMYLYWAEK